MCWVCEVEMNTVRHLISECKGISPILSEQKADLAGAPHSFLARLKGCLLAGQRKTKIRTLVEEGLSATKARSEIKKIDIIRALQCKSEAGGKRPLDIRGTTVHDQTSKKTSRMI